MGQIAAAYDLMPESTEVDLDNVMTKILPVAFGLMKVNAGFLIDDSDEEVGGKLEDALRAIAGIENVECVSNTVV